MGPIRNLRWEQKWTEGYVIVSNVNLILATFSQESRFTQLKYREACYIESSVSLQGYFVIYIHDIGSKYSLS